MNINNYLAATIERSSLTLCESILIASRYAANPDLFYPTPRRALKKSPNASAVAAVLASCEKNKNKCCSVTGCGEPRYITDTGVARGAKCKAHKKIAQAIAWERYKGRSEKKILTATK